MWAVSTGLAQQTLDTLRRRTKPAADPEEEVITGYDAEVWAKRNGR